MEDREDIRSGNVWPESEDGLPLPVPLGLSIAELAMLEGLLEAVRKGQPTARSFLPVERHR